MRKSLIVFILVSLLFYPMGSVFPSERVMGDYMIAGIQKRVSLDLEGASLVDVLKMLSQQTGLNFVSTEIVQERRLTLYIERVPLKEALDIIFKANNLTYDYFPEANVFVVKEMGKPHLELKTKIYRLKYARVAPSNMQKEVASTMGAGKGEEAGILKAVEKVLSDLGKVSEEPLTNALIITDVPSQFPMIEQVVFNLDVPVPRVMIEVEMLDVSKSEIDSLGVNWAEANLAKLDVTGARLTAFPFWGQLKNTTSFIGSDIESPSGFWEFDSLDGSNFAPSVFTMIGANLALDLLKTLTTARSLARPKILTLSNQTAEIRITTDEAIGIQQSTTDTGGTNFTIERTETGTRLRVTPQVNTETGEITLFVEAVVKEASASDFTLSSVFVAGDVKDPEERSAKSIVRLKNGDTLLVGGLIKQEETETEIKVPLFGDIPFVGRLFRHKDVTVSERELFIFITPHIVEDGPSFAGRTRFPSREQDSSGNRGDTVKIALDRYSPRR
ncbi:MAG: secretin N-terminal domain-containing protein [Candidatus Omnitrophota bacterium]